MNELMSWKECEQKHLRKVYADREKISYFKENYKSFEEIVKLLLRLVRDEK